MLRPAPRPERGGRGSSHGGQAARARPKPAPQQERGVGCGVGLLRRAQRWCGPTRALGFGCVDGLHRRVHCRGGPSFGGGCFRRLQVLCWGGSTSGLQSSLSPVFSADSALARGGWPAVALFDRRASPLCPRPLLVAPGTVLPSVSALRLGRVAGTPGLVSVQIPKDCSRPGARTHSEPDRSQSAIFTNGWIENLSEPLL